MCVSVSERTAGESQRARSETEVVDLVRATRECVCLKGTNKTASVVDEEEKTDGGQENSLTESRC